MKRLIIRIALYLILALSAAAFGLRFKAGYEQIADRSAGRYENVLEDAAVEPNPEPTESTDSKYPLGVWGLGLVLSLVGLGIVVAQDISRFLGSRTVDVLFDDRGEGIPTSQYETAEEEWSEGNHLEAVRLMRECLEQNPKEQHIALRIAEIYEKDLHNYLAAALEYEEVLQKKLPRERWGWAAIHLCNLYTSRLNQPDKAIALLNRINSEYGDTMAAEKARSRLAHLEAEGHIGPDESLPPDEGPPEVKLPPGFSRKKP